VGLLTRIEGVPDEIGRLHARVASASSTTAALRRLRVLAWCSRVLARVLPLSMGLGGAAGVAVVAWLDGSRVLGVLAFVVAGVLAVSAAMLVQLGLLLLAVRGALRALAAGSGTDGDGGSAGDGRAR
jgi:hypothetical protein